ncbi:Peroxidase 2 [Carex littledalei]|uniref:Peroxidase n=1 Tax=Carex littledalei TaxID=544730 RepID=A0A833RDN7_9POAL|nr:Peroxidase 2 [Carex littledalei]
MESKTSILITCLIFATAFQLLLPLSEASGRGSELKVGYYKDKCQKAESIVTSTVSSYVKSYPGLGGGLIRMFFHDCFVRGCDASVLLDPTPENNQTEKLAIPNFPSLRGFEVIDAAKAELEKECKGVVSCADIIALAARDASYLLGNIFYKIPTGRLDGRVSNSTEALLNLPPPFFNLTQLEALFATKGLNAFDLVALSGAHSIGRSHCSSFTSRLYPTIDPTMDQNFGASLRKLCPDPKNATNDGVVPQDFVTPDKLDEQYYKNVESLTALFFSDWSLLTSSETSKQVDTYTKEPETFKQDFANAMVKMGNIEVLTGPPGEVRGPTCRFVN